MADYEVFISFRNSDDLGRPTRDKDMAEALYRALTARGIRAFYSNRSINEAGAADYVEAIDDALDSSSILVAVGTCRENLEAFWVKDEIKRFRTDMLNGVKERGKSAMISYRTPDFPPKALPNGLRHNQSYTDLSEVVKFIETFLKKGSGFRNIGDHTEILYNSYEDRPMPLPPKPVLPKPAKAEGGSMEVGTVIDGKYKILKMVGRGGTSEVYLAINERLNKTVAVKVIREFATREFELIKKSILSEADLLRKLDHPSFPRIHEAIDWGDRLYLIMDFVEGESLNQILERSGPLDEETALEIGCQLADVLQYMHSRPKPVIYRDMKPANVIMKPDGRLMLIDFGTAREYKETAMGDTACLGTVGYAAPEQFGGMGQTDARTDIYCLGATLYHLVTGCNPCKPPYEIRPIRQFDQKLSQGLEYIIGKCTRRDPADRFQTAAELLDALRNVDKLTRRARFDPFFQIAAFGKKKNEGKPQLPQGQLQQPRRTESLMDTTILSPEPPVSAPPKGGFAVPAAVPPPHMPPVPSFGETGVLSQSAAAPALEETEILNRPAPPLYVPPAPEPAKPKKRKVTVRAKAAADPELEEMIAKLSALDPESQKLVRQLIDQLSK